MSVLGMTVVFGIVQLAAILDIFGPEGNEGIIGLTTAIVERRRSKLLKDEDEDQGRDEGQDAEAETETTPV